MKEYPLLRIGDYCNNYDDFAFKCSSGLVFYEEQWIKVISVGGSESYVRFLSEKEEDTVDTYHLMDNGFFFRVASSWRRCRGRWYYCYGMVGRNRYAISSVLMLRPNKRLSSDSDTALLSLVTRQKYLDIKSAVERCNKGLWRISAISPSFAIRNEESGKVLLYRNKIVCPLDKVDALPSGIASLFEREVG